MSTDVKYELHLQVIGFARFRQEKLEPFFSRGSAVSSSIKDKNRQVSLLKLETIGTILNWNEHSHITPSFPRLPAPKIKHDSIT